MSACPVAVWRGHRGVLCRAMTGAPLPAPDVAFALELWHSFVQFLSDVPSSYSVYESHPY